MKPKPSDKPDEKMRDLCSNLYKDRWGKPYVLTDGQLKIFERIVKRDHPRVHLTTFTQYGKEISHHIPVLTSNGWTTHGELKVGDYVYNAEGEAVMVEGLSDESESTLEVEFTNGEKIECHKNHEWVVRHKEWKRWGRGFEVMETKKLFMYVLKNKTQHTFTVPNIKPLEYGEKNLKLNPYTLGAWLGDGTSSKPSITSVDKEIIANIEYKPSSINVHKDTGVSLFNFYKCDFLKGLRKYDLLKNKHIPEDFKMGSIKQRLELLAGLIDTDGYVSSQKRKSGDTDGRVYFTNVNKRLIDDVCEVIVSLGMRPSVVKVPPCLSSSGIQGKQEVYIVGFDAFLPIPTVLPRKKITPKTKQKHIAIKSITKIEPVKGRCIQVTGGIYLVGKKLVPTHNSATVALAVLTRAATYPEKWMIVAGREKQAKIIMSYIIEHTFDNDYTKGKLEIGGEDIERLQRERSKNRLTFRHADGGLGEIMILSADSRNQQAAGESLMGFGCIPAGYKIFTNKGELLIEDVVKNKMDVKILSYNHLTEETEYKEILEYQENPVADRHILEFDCGEKFRCTNDHPVFVEDKGYIRADEVEEGDFIRKVPTLRGLYSRIVKKITRVEAKSPYVYNLNVKDNHNYFIEGILLHNSQNVVLDEAALIDDETEVKIFRMLGGFKDNFYLKIGNPFRRNHFWKDSLNPDWYHLNIDWKQGVKEGRIEESFIREAKQKPLFDILYENKFPPEEMMDEHGYIPIIDERDLVEVKDEQMTRSKVLGVDPAGEGRDEAKWVVRDAFKVKVVATEKISNPKSMAQRTMTVMLQEDIAPNNVFVDSFGVGAPLIAELARSGVPVNAVNVGDKMPKGSEEAERFFNKRAWMFWEFREWAKQGGVFVKNPNWKEILSVKFRAELDRRLKIMSKDEMRRKGILSPNTVDAAMLTFSNGKDILGRFKEYSGSSGNIVNSDQYSAI